MDNKLILDILKDKNIAQKILDGLKQMFSSKIIVMNNGNKKLKVVDTDGFKQLFSTKGSKFDMIKSSFYGATSVGDSSTIFNIPRQTLYRDYEIMESDPIIASALDIYSDLCITKNLFDLMIQIMDCKDLNVKKILNNLYYDILNINFNLWPWVRSLVKYGDFFLELKLAPGVGVIDYNPLSPYLVLRLELPVDKQSGCGKVLVLFKLQSDTTVLLKNHQVAHFRLLNDTNIYPYGKSMILPARTIWKKYTLLMDAVLVQRITRAAAKFVFNVDPGDLSPLDAEAYLNLMKTSMKKAPYVDKNGNIDLRYNIQNMMLDYWVLKNGDSGTSILTLPGLLYNVIDDVMMFRNNMMAALKIPKAFLNFLEDVNAKCLGPDTKVQLLNGNVFSIKLISDLFLLNPDIEIYTLSFDFLKKLFVPSRIVNCCKTRLNALVIKLHFDNNSSVICTPDHNFITEDLLKIHAEDITIETKLCGIDVVDTPRTYNIVNIEKLELRIDTYNLLVEHKDHNFILYDCKLLTKNSTLSSMDIRFTRTILHIQQVICNLLKKIGIIHLYLQGYRRQDLLNWKIQLTNPSNVKLMQLLLLWNNRVDLATAMMLKKQFSRLFIYKNVYKMSNKLILQLMKNIIKDAKYLSYILNIVNNGALPDLNKLNSFYGDEVPEKLKQDGLLDLTNTDMYDTSIDKLPAMTDPLNYKPQNIL